MKQRFEGKTAFITWAASGIGEALARRLAAEGARVALAARREDRLASVCREIEATGGTALAVRCDVTDPDSVANAVAQTVAAFGGIDVAVANAGFGVTGPIQSLTTDDFRRQFETNFFGVVETIRAVLPHLLASRGRLGVVGSLLGRVGTPGTSPYAASKFALSGLCESIGHELAGSGVSVTLINPGLVKSEIRHKDNRGVLHAERPDPAPDWLVASAESAAAEIATALHRRRFEAVITGHAKVVLFAARHFPGLMRQVARRFGRNKGMAARPPD
jgi:NAD(P)-dependent dehydrogenase (short-subunit alcohol dehydrogenase family)